MPILAFLTARKLGLANWLWLLLAVGVLTIGFVLWLNAREREAVEADRAKAAVEALERAREADQRAHEAVTSKTEEVERLNDEARKAADASDDALAAALERLRSRQTGNDQAAR